MPADALVAKFGGKKRPPKFEDEGPPEMEDPPRGGGAGVGDSGNMPEPDADDAGGPPDGDADNGMPPDMTDPAEKSIDDLCDIAGIGPEDREDFANALKAYVHSCIEEAMVPDMGNPDVGSEAMPEGPPGTDEEP